MKKKVLFVAEGATLAHVGRPLCLAGYLDPSEYELGFACDPRYETLLKPYAFAARFAIDSIATKEFNRRLAKGKPLFPTHRLMEYVERDLEVIGQFQPELIIGDLRLSLAVSARLSGVPYACVTNAYWSPYFENRRFVIGDHPLTRTVGVGRAQRLFTALAPVLHRFHCTPLNRTFRAFGLETRLSDIGAAYSEADYCLYPDIPELYPSPNLPDHHVFLGACLWEPQNELPEWWNRIPEDKPIVYVALGSSGAHGVLQTLVRRLAAQDVVVLMASSHQSLDLEELPPNVFVSPYLPGKAACRRADLVIFNGGSGTAQQASCAGTPMLAICSNSDQLMGMQSIQDQGAGLVLRSDDFGEGSFDDAVGSLLTDPGFRNRAQALAAAYQSHDPGSNFQRFLDRVLSDTYAETA